MKNIRIRNITESNRQNEAKNKYNSVFCLISKMSKGSEILTNMMHFKLSVLPLKQVSACMFHREARIPQHALISGTLQGKKE